MSLPPSVKKIELFGIFIFIKSIFINNDIYRSNYDRTAIYSKDGSELIFVTKGFSKFIIPNDVKIIRKHALFHSNISDRITIPASVEIVEDHSLYFSGSVNWLDTIEFEEGSKLKSLDLNSFSTLKQLILSNDNFIQSEYGVVMSLNPRGIVFVPKHLTELEIDSKVVVIFSHAFLGSRHQKSQIPKYIKTLAISHFIIQCLNVSHLKMVLNLMSLVLLLL